MARECMCIVFAWREAVESVSLCVQHALRQAASSVGQSAEQRFVISDHCPGKRFVLSIKKSFLSSVSAVLQAKLTQGGSWKRL